MRTLKFFAAAIIGILAVVACEPKEVITGEIEIKTNEVTEVTPNSAVCGGEVVSDGGMSVTAFGVCWSTKTNPTTADSKTMDGEGLGKFVSDLSDLEPGQTYYVRAYAVNANGVAYGDEKIFSTGAVLATVNTAAMSDVTFETATTGGVVAFDGGSDVTKVGVCWGKTENPDINGLHTEDEIEEGGTFVSYIDGLEPDETFYVRAYATNSEGTSYGEQIQFSTSSEPCIDALSESAIMNYVIANYDLNNDGKIQISEAQGVTVLDLHEMGITSLEGLDQFENLIELNVNGNALASVDLTNLKNLQNLYACNMQGLVSMNVAGLENLQYVLINDTGISSIDLTAAKGLVQLDAWWTHFESIDISQNTLLELINLDTAPIKALDASNHTKLTYLNVNNTPIESLSVNGCESLVELYAANTPLTLIDASNLAALKTFWAFNLTSQDGVVKADNCPSLEYLHAYNSNLSVLSAKGCPVLREFRCFGNPNVTAADFTGSFTTNSGEINLDGAHLESFTIDKNNTLWYLNLCQNRLTELDLKGGFTSLVEFYNNGSTLQKINVEGLPSLKYMHSCDNLTDGTLEVYADNCPELVETIFQNAKLSKFQVRNCPKLITYRVWGNSTLTEVDATGCTSLVEINADGAPLTTLKISAEDNPNLWYLNIHSNKLTSLDLSGFSALNQLHCGNAHLLTSIKYAPNLEYIYHFNDILLETVNVSGLSKLICLWCYGDNEDWRVATKNLIISGNPALTEIRAFFNQLTAVDIRGAADAINLGWFDANPQLKSITMRSSQTITDFHRDSGCEIIIQ